jgi:hypothetical protein
LNLPSSDPRFLALVSKVESAEVLDFTQPDVQQHSTNGASQPNIEDEGPATEVSASWLRAILMSLPVPAPDTDDPKKMELRSVRITSAGVHVCSAVITGQLDLDDLAGPGGAPLPALRFENCRFEKGINIRRCHLRSLTLKKCSLTELQAEEAVIDGPVKLTDLRRPAEITLKDSNGQDAKSWGCYVVLRGAQIAGHLNCARSLFAAMPRAKDQDPFVQNSRHSRYALDLRATRIRGSALLRPDVKAFGGVSFTLAQVRGSIWCNGAELTAVEDCAFSADYADIQGSLYLRTRDRLIEKESVRFVARGQVSLFATKIGGSLYMEGADLQVCKLPKDKAEAEAYESLDATNATIGGNCKLCSWQSFTEEKRLYPFNAKGKIVLNSALIRNDLSLSGANVESVYASNIEVGGECRMSVYEASPKVPEYPRLTATAIHLEGAVIKGDFLMRGAAIGRNDEKANKDYGLFARGAKIGGDCQLTTFPHEDGSKGIVLRFECFGRILLQEASIGNSLVMAGARLIWTLPGPYPALDASGTTIGGHAKFMTWNPDESVGGIPFEVHADEIGLRLAGTKIAQKLIFNGAIIRTSKIAINAANIEIGGKASLGVYTEKGSRAMNPPRAFAFTAFGEVIFTCATIKLGLDMSGACLKPPQAETFRNDAESVVNLVALDLTLARTKFAELVQVQAVGQVIMKHAEIDTDVNLTGGRFEGPVVFDYARIGASAHLTRIQLWCGSVRMIYEKILNRNRKLGGNDLLEGAVADELARHHAGKLMFADLSLHSAKIGGALIVSNLKTFQKLDSARDSWVSMPNELSHVTVDLRGLQIEELQDSGGDGWEKSVRFWLDGFRYSRLNQLPHSLEGPSVHDSTSLRRGRLLSPDWLPAYRRSNDEVWRPRLRWLELQYFDKNRPQSAEFTPGAYEQLVKVLNLDGLYEDARRIASAKITLETRVSPKVSKKIAWGLFRIFFDYGFSPRRAVCTFLLCLAVGALAAQVADHGLPKGFPQFGKVLFVNTSPPETMIVEEAGSVSVHSIKGDKSFLYMDDVPCGDRIRPVLYALDVFVPVLDLRQQSACSISRDKVVWRYAQAAYAVLGWFLTPLTLLTFSGILKKHLER